MLQSKEQRDNVIGVKTFFLDASYKGITAYGYAFYALIARAIASGAGTPVGYIITSTDDQVFYHTFANVSLSIFPSQQYVWNVSSFLYYCFTVSIYLLILAPKEQLTRGLQAMKDADPNMQPRSFTIDRDLREIDSIEAVFPNVFILLCWFHVLQAVYRWLNARGSMTHY